MRGAHGVSAVFQSFEGPRKNKCSILELAPANVYLLHHHASPILTCYWQHFGAHTFHFTWLRRMWYVQFGRPCGLDRTPGTWHGARTWCFENSKHFTSSLSVHEDLGRKHFWGGNFNVAIVVLLVFATTVVVIATGGGADGDALLVIVSLVSLLAVACFCVGALAHWHGRHGRVLQLSVILKLKCFLLFPSSCIILPALGRLPYSCFPWGSLGC